MWRQLVLFHLLLTYDTEHDIKFVVLAVDYKLPGCKSADTALATGLRRVESVRDYSYWIKY